MRGNCCQSQSRGPDNFKKLVDQCKKKYIFEFVGGWKDQPKPGWKCYGNWESKHVQWKKRNRKSYTDITIWAIVLMNQ